MTAVARMAVRLLRGERTRLALTVVALAIGVALVTAIDLANRAVYAAFADAVDVMAGRTSFVVAAGDRALFPEEVATTVAAVPGVEIAVPVVSATAFLTDGSGEQLAVHGIDVGNDAAVRVYERASSSGPEDPLLFLAQKDSILLTDVFAARHGLAIDDPIVLDTPTGRLRFVVRGLLSPTGVGRLQGGNLLVMDLFAAEVAFARKGFIHRVDVVVRAGDDAGAVRDRIAAALPPGLRVELPAQRRIDLGRVLAAAQTMLSAVGVLGVFAAFLIAFSRLGSAFEARVGELAILRALGVREGRVRSELMHESAFVALAGIATGIPLGIGLGWLVLPVIGTATSIAAQLPAPDAVMRAEPASLLLAAATGLAAVLLAALEPARRAAAVPVIATLRSRTLERAEPSATRRRLVAPLAACLAVVAVVIHVRSGTAASGLAATGLVVVAAAALVPAALAASAGVIRWLAIRLIGPGGRLIAATLEQAPRRTAVTVAMLGIGFGTLVWLATVAQSFQASMMQVTPSVLRGDLVAMSAHDATGYIPAPIDEGLIAEIAAVAGVRAVVGNRTADWHHAGGPIALNAFDPMYFADTTFGTWRLLASVGRDALALVARGEGVLVSESFVRNIGGAVGGALRLDAPDGALELPIAGIVADFLSPRGSVLMSRALYRSRWHDPHLTQAFVRVTDGTAVETVRAELSRTLATRRELRIWPIADLMAFFRDQARKAFGALDVLAALVLVVVLVGVGDALAAGMLERTREIGTVRAIGVRRGTVAGMVVVESLLLAGLGLCVAAVLGFGLGILWVQSTFPALVGWSLWLDVPVARILGLAASALAVCLLGACIPALRAARLAPAVALRTE